MSAQAIDIKDNLTKYDLIIEGHKITIVSEGGATTAVFNPKNPDDVNRLCRSAKIEEFIHEDTKRNYPNLLLFKNSHYNHGVIANQAIKKNKIICIYRGEIDSLDRATNKQRVKKMLEKEFKISSSTHTPETLKKMVNSYIDHVTHYAFERLTRVGPKDTILAHKKRSVAGFINHNTTDPNVIVEINKGIIYYKAARNINPHEQLTVDYGPDYDYQDPLFYIHSFENHLKPGTFLAENIEHYHKIPIQLTPEQKALLQTQYSWVIIPKFLYGLLNNPTYKQINAFDKRLPIIEVSHYSKSNTIYVPEQQSYITPLMFACILQSKQAIETLIIKYKVDVFAKSIHDKDALILAIESSDSEKALLHFAKPLIKKIVSTIKRTDSIASNHQKRSALHILVQREWCKTITLFKQSIFFDVVDSDGYDAFIYALTTGKTQSLITLLTMDIVKKILIDLLFAKDEKFNDFVLKRALRDIPHTQFNEILLILQKTLKRKPIYAKKLIGFLKRLQYK